MKITKAEFIKSATKADQFPNFLYPEFAFIGKSNVGKSSLINMLCNRKSLVKTGARPGLTQMINFFLINDSISFADLPGYGYAKAPENVRKKFIPMIKQYFEKRENLKVVFLLLDCRRDVTEKDKEIITTIAKCNIPTAILLTKADKLTNKQIKEAKSTIADDLEINESDIEITSASKSCGKNEVFSIIREFI